MTQPKRLPVPLPFGDGWILVKLPEHPAGPDQYWSHDLGWVLNAGAAKSFALSGDARDYMQANSHRMDQD